MNKSRNVWSIMHDAADTFPPGHIFQTNMLGRVPYYKPSNEYISTIRDGLEEEAKINGFLIFDPDYKTGSYSLKRISIPN